MMIDKNNIIKRLQRIKGNLSTFYIWKKNYPLLRAANVKDIKEIHNGRNISRSISGKIEVRAQLFLWQVKFPDFFAPTPEFFAKQNFYNNNIKNLLQLPYDGFIENQIHSIFLKNGNKNANEPLV